MHIAVLSTVTGSNLHIKVSSQKQVSIYILNGAIVLRGRDTKTLLCDLKQCSTVNILSHSYMYVCFTAEVLQYVIA